MHACLCAGNPEAIRRLRSNLYFSTHEHQKHTKSGNASLIYCMQQPPWVVGIWKTNDARALHAYMPIDTVELFFLFLFLLQ